jgi:arylsulfatase
MKQRQFGKILYLFNTSLGVAGIHDSIPTERYIDGIDQSSFLLTADGESK